MTPEEQEKQRLQERIDTAEAELQKALNDIFKKPIQNLTVEDKGFLQARRSYLEDRQLEKYADVLNEKLPRPDGQEEEVKEKKSKK